jgi:hypothetical protein
LKILQQYDAFKQTSASPTLKSKKENLDTTDPQQVPRQRRRSQGPLDPVAEEGQGENEVVQSVNPVANVAANAPANPATNAPVKAPANAAGNVVNNAANAANFQGNAAPNPRHNAGAQPPPVQANRAEGSQRHRIREEVEIARRAN